LITLCIPHSSLIVCDAQQPYVEAVDCEPFARPAADGVDGEPCLANNDDDEAHRWGSPPRRHPVQKFVATMLAAVSRPGADHACGHQY